MSLTSHKVAIVTLNVATHPSFNGTDLPAGTYSFNEGESIPEGAIITALRSDTTTTFVSGTSVTLNIPTVGAISTADVTADLAAGQANLVLAASATAIKATAPGAMTFTTVGNFTVGVARFLVDYII